MATHRKCHRASDYAFVFCLFAVLFEAVTCDEMNVKIHKLSEELDPILRGDGDNVFPTAEVDNKDNFQIQISVFPTIIYTETPETPAVEERETTQSTHADTTHSNPPEKHSLTSQGNVVCVDKIPAQYKNAVLLKLKTSSTCEETKARIQSVIEHLCGEDCKLEIYQKDNTNEITVYGDSIEADADGMAEIFNNDNITDKVDLDEAVSRVGQRTKVILISLLVAGLLLAALLIAGYLLKTRRGQSKGLQLAEDCFQVDQENQGNTLLSVAPLPQQERLDKPIINGESPDSPPTNGHSTTQTQVVDTAM